MLYSTAAYGALGGSGTLFAVALGSSPTPPTLLLAVRRSGTNMLISWSTNFTGYALYFTTNLVPADWIIEPARAVMVGEEYVVTNGYPGVQKFCRLGP